MAQDLVAFLHETSERYSAKTALMMKLGIRYRTWTYEAMWAESARIAEKSRPTMGFAPGAGSALGVDIVLLEAAGGTGHRDRHQSLHQRGVEQWFRHQTAQLRCDGGWGVQGHAWLLDRCNRRLQFLLRWNRWRPAWPVLRAERTQYS